MKKVDGMRNVWSGEETRRVKAQFLFFIVRNPHTELKHQEVTVKQVMLSYGDKIHKESTRRVEKDCFGGKGMERLRMDGFNKLGFFTRYLLFKLHVYTV